MSHPIRCQGCHLGFPIGTKNTKLVEDVERFVEFVSAVKEKTSRFPSQSEALAAIFALRSTRKNRQLDRGVEILLLVKFWRNLFSC